MMPSDLSLLRAFSDQQSESAFAALVQRHLDLVHSAATRLARSRHLAEEVAQGVFLALAQQCPRVARKVEGGMPLSAWLHLTTRNLAAKLIRSETRRVAREQASSTMQPASDSPNSSSSDWERIVSHLDQGLGELSESDRRVVLLRYFEGKSAREIGQHLGIAEEAAQKRVLRALDRLRSHLARHAPSLSSSTLGVLLGAWAVQKAPAALASSIAHAAFQGLGTVPSHSLIEAIQRICTDTLMTKSQTIATGAVIAALAVPIAYQANEIQDLRQRTTPIATQSIEPSPRPTLTEASDALPSKSRAPATRSDVEEIARLRARADELRTAIAKQRNTQASPPQTIQATAGPLLLKPGQPVAVTNLVVAGTDSPEAAAQTLLAHMREGNLDATLALLLLSPEERAELESEILKEASARDGLVERMRSEMDSLLTVELLGVESLAERRSAVSLQRVTPNATNVLRLVFGRTTSGWKQIQ